MGLVADALSPQLTMDLNTKTYFCHCHLCELQDDITVLGRGYRCTRSPPAGNKLRCCRCCCCCCCCCCCRGGKPTLSGQDGWFYRRHTMPLQAPDQSEYHVHNCRWIEFSSVDILSIFYSRQKKQYSCL